MFGLSPFGFLFIVTMSTIFVAFFTHVIVKFVRNRKSLSGEIKKFNKHYKFLKWYYEELHPNGHEKDNALRALELTLEKFEDDVEILKRTDLNVGKELKKVSYARFLEETDVLKHGMKYYEKYGGKMKHEYRESRLDKLLKIK